MMRPILKILMIRTTNIKDHILVVKIEEVIRITHTIKKRMIMEIYRILAEMIKIGMSILIKMNNNFIDFY